MTQDGTAAPTQAPTEPPKPTPAALGYSAYAKKLDETVYRRTDLGAVYSKEKTTFKVWSPAADDVKVCIYKTGSDDEEGFKNITIKTMNYSKTVGTWYITLKGDYKNMYYTYRVTVGDSTYEVVDPYAKAVGVNGNRGMIVDLKDTDPDGWAKDSFKRVNKATDAIVWEVSVRDFSAAMSSGVCEKNRGKFLAFTEDGTTLDGVENRVSTCVAYLKELGVNYVQINPFYDFASIDESKSLDDQYNWGYDPKNYNVPEGSYSSDPYDGRVRIKECKQMIQALHKAGIGVIMDVVYNHTYFSEDSYFNQLVPAYYHRINEDGSWSNGSGCGNDVATERFMASKFIRESVSYWAKEYHIDGFRFDLMGLMDVKTMNGIRADLNTLPDGNKIIMYGEAWNMSTTVPSDVNLANQNNMHLLSKGIAAFNDTGRDAIKGSNFNASEKGFVQQGSSKSGVRSAIEGTGDGWASTPSQCVNYVSCHDNMTLYDKLTASVYGDSHYDYRREDLDKMNRLAAAIVMTSRGMPFMLAGEELGRTKNGDENSYISPVSVNAIDWRSRYRFTSLTDYYQGLIKIRKAIPALRVADGSASKMTELKATGKKTIAYSVTAAGSASVVIAFNGDTSSSTVTLPAGDWVVAADENRAGLSALDTVSKTVKVPATSAYILIDAKSFAKIKEEAPQSVVYLRYIDTADDDCIVCEERMSGKLNEKYKAVTPSEVLFQYDVTDDSALSGTFTKAFEILNVKCEKYEGDYSTVTIKYLDEQNRALVETVVMTNRVGQQYFTPSIPGVKGYSLDTDNLPENAAGTFTENPIEVVYRYHTAEELMDEEEGYPCFANVIYLADDGKILKLKSLKGKKGDKVSCEELEFEGYDYVGISDGKKVFSDTELNVILSYEKPRSSFITYLIIAGAALLVLGIAAAGVMSAAKRKQKRLMAIDIEE